MGTAKDELLSEEEYKKKEKQLEAYRKIQREGIWLRSLKMALGLSIGLSILPALSQPLIAVLPRFIFSFIICFIIFLATWPNVGRKIKHLTAELEQKKKIKKTRKTDPIHLLIFFILLAIILLPVVFKKEISELDRKFNELNNRTKIEKVNAEYSLKPVTLNIKFSDQFSADMTIPEAYLAMGNTYKKDGVLSDILSTTKIHLAAFLPDMEPWKLTKETLEQIQQDSEILKDKDTSLVNRILRSDHNFISINLTSFFPKSSQEAGAIYSKIQRRKTQDYHLITSEDKYGLHVYDAEVAIPSNLEGRSVYFYTTGIVAEPINEKAYPPMIFICDSICTILSNYQDKAGLAVSFHSANLAKWQEIWEKANSKVNSMIKWDIK